jgi:hypothetical protein
MTSSQQLVAPNWTKVSYKRGRSPPDASERESKQAKDSQHWLHPPSTATSNRFSPLMETNNNAECQHNPSPEHPPKPPPTYMQDVTSIPPLLQLLEQVASHQYETKALANNQVP